MNIVELQKKYEDGHISKQDYITDMYKYHHALYDYSDYIKKTDISKIEIVEDGVYMTHREFGIKMKCLPNDLRIAPIETLNFLSYESAELRSILKFIKPAPVVLDIGANIGWYSLVLSRLFPDSEIHAIEPSEKMFESLQLHIAINDAQNIQSYKLGMSEKSGESVFFEIPNNSVNSSMMNLTDDPTAKSQIVVVKTVDDFCTENKITKVDFIKCDVEGAELLVLKGAVETLKNKPLVFCEMVRKWAIKFNYHPNEIIKFMKKFGYEECYAISEKGLRLIAEMDDFTTETNFLFVPSSENNSCL